MLPQPKNHPGVYVLHRRRDDFSVGEQKLHDLLVGEAKIGEKQSRSMYCIIYRCAQYNWKHFSFYPSHTVPSTTSPACLILVVMATQSVLSNRSTSTARGRPTCMGSANVYRTRLRFAAPPNSFFAQNPLSPKKSNRNHFNSSWAITKIIHKVH